jgi:RNA polymerase sigma-70 factor (ECF subfamily)
MCDPADSTLIEAAMGGDRSAFAELVKRYKSAVWSTVYRTLGNSPESEDIVQEVFLRVLVSLPRFDRRYPFSPWILRIASNCCIDELRRKKTRKYRLFSDLSESEEGRLLNALSTLPDSDPLHGEDADRYLEIARSLLEGLKPKHRMAFVLRELEGRCYEEVAKILGVPEVTARVRVWRARTDLHREFRKRLAAWNRGIKNEEGL